MPLKRKVNKKRTFKRRTSRKVYKYTNRLPAQLIPSERYVTMKCAFALNEIAMAVGDINYAYFNPASVYDPMATTGSRKPYGTDTMFTMYNYATVMSNKIQCIAMGPYQDTNPLILLLALQKDNTAMTTIDGYSDFYETPLRMKGAKVKMFGNFITKSLDGNNKITALYTAKDYFGKEAKIGSDPDYASTDSGNPAIQPHMGVYATTPAGSGVASAQLYFMIIMSMIVKWWSPKNLDNDG